MQDEKSRFDRICTLRWFELRKDLIKDLPCKEALGQTLKVFPFQVLLGQPPSAELYGFVADYLEHKLQERAGSSMTEERPADETLTPLFRRLDSQNSFDRNIDEITRASVQSATMDHTPSPKKRILRREGTFSIYDSGKNTKF